MSLAPGQDIELDVEKPAAGGRMIARHDGRIILVQGAIPGERVRAHVDTVDKRLAFASVRDVVTPSSDRRAVAADPLCGGCVFAHIEYGRQLALKSEIIADAFARIGRITLDRPVTVAASPERGYRMRARLHVSGGRPGFFREGTHQLCEAGPTGQLLESSLAAADAALTALGEAVAEVTALQISENVAAEERAFHLELRGASRLAPALLTSAVAEAGLTGCTARSPEGGFCQAGDAVVADPLEKLTHGRAASGELRRHAASFFQGNRFLLPDLVSTVLDNVAPDGAVLDLYAGVGVFSVSLAATGRGGITAVEGDRESGADLLRNAAVYRDRIQAVVGRVEEQVRRHRGAPGTVIVDPPRTGLSKDALDALAQLGAPRTIYVSCDPPTMARDAARLVETGCRIASLQGFDLFPNTAHVETVAVFERV